ncbi:ExeM/NucH family extracellular endonuclease [Nocardioides sp. zg-536]|uniref:ExeM/NucH family extracellular endonuclease n=1 Tax=Nocardioides faecalis TaxID=2803858 RepID=A0A938Y919_9ACTN|nr:ExeM/NucH family extracellular endonuclease [Nocardioides faecalis]MBM9460080.1 ExeM/NucH family extracellular endonuclease [Nocardioides faecalis]QVI60123.1 ExeM/NucH family extracellular endonuclease [Nocardioides faecalis]
MRSVKKLLFGSLSVVLAAGGLSALQLAPASANPAGTGLVITEVYGGGGNSGATYSADYVELFNPTAAPIALGGSSLQYRAAANTAAAANTFALPDVSVPAGKHYLVQCAGGANGGPLPTADTTACTLNLSGTAGQVFLASTTTGIAAQTNGAAPWAFHDAVVDFVGFGTAAVFEGAASAPAPSNTTSISRSGAADTDSNSADFAVLAAAAMTPTNSKDNVFEAADQADVTAYVGVPMPALTLKASGGKAPYTWSAAALPAGLSLSSAGVLSGTSTGVGRTEVVATATDSSTPAKTDTVRFAVVVEDAPAALSIAAVQGNGATSPQEGRAVTVEGVVTGSYADPTFANNGYDGFYVQTGGTGGATDTTPGRSDAIFVYYGNAGAPAGIATGDSVRVTGLVSEFSGTTQIAPFTGGVVELDAALPAVAPLQIAYPRTETGREAQEGMLLAPTDDEFTVTNVYNLNTFAEIGLASGGTPLRQPTEFAAPGDAAALQAIKDDNAARGVVLDDGTAVNYLTNTAAKNQPLPWLTPDNPIRVGARATLAGPVILEYRNNTWKFQPPAPVYDDGDTTVTFEDTRAANATPRDVGGDLKLATFNVLNYFNTTGEAYVAAGAAQSPPVNAQCTYYTDRANNRIGNNTCGVVGSDGKNAGNGPRGAATSASLARQTAKIVTAINTMGADIVGLQEIESSVKLLGEVDRDDALRYLVAALNAEAGAGTWRFVHSPGEATLTASVSEQDVIRPAFLYRAAKVEPVGSSDILFGTTEFANAREPLAQAFKAKGALDSDAFAVVLNHFKSKGDSDPVATGDNANDPDVGAFNGDRVRQATRLAAFADEFAEARGIEAVFLAGDFNSYSREQPIQVLESSGYALIDSPGEETYSFSGLSGSLDHVLGNQAAVAMVTGSDVWDINASESVAFQYSRHNYNVTDFWQPNQPFAASDHNPEIVGIDVPAVGGPYKRVQVVGTNDFHGRILPSGGDSAGASVLSGAVKELRADNPNTVFVAAGDLVGASTFESFIQEDAPTIDALNEAGLEVSAVGNHEFDAGYEDLVGRIQDRADWEYLATNVTEPDGRDELVERWTKTMDGIEVGFVGAVTEDLPTLVSPSGIEGVTVTDIVEAANAEAAALKETGVDLVVLLVHEGSPSTDCTSASFTDPATVWGNITQNTSADVDAIVSGHTHLAYNCSFPVTEWQQDGRAVTERPVVSAGQYGQNLNKLVFTYAGDDELVAVSQDIVGIAGTGFEVDGAVTPIVDAAVVEAEERGKVVIGEIEAPFNRAKLANGTTENRGGESTLGNLVAEVQRWATEKPESGSAQIAFMNPGGLRQDMTGTVDGDARALTYKQAAVVQPFANTLVNMDLTGAQIETVLEQQWQRTTAGAVPSRPFLRLGVSEGFTYTYTETPETVGGTATFTGEITGMWLDGVPIDPAATYSVTVNSFLASGGDNFHELAKGSGPADTGKSDLQAMVDYMKATTETAPLPVDASQRAVGINLPAGAPSVYGPGDVVAFDVSSWTMSTADDAKDSEIQVRLGDTTLGTVAVDNTIGTAVYDQYGKASVSITLPATLPADATLRLVGATTGTEIQVPIALAAAAEPEVVNTAPPTIVGTAQVGRTLRAVDGTWNPAPTALARQWYADGKPIAGATGTLFRPTAAQAGKRITVTVTATLAGHTNGTATSAPTAKVAKGKVSVRVKASPKALKVRRTKATVRVTVRNAYGVPVTGTVTIKAAGQKARKVKLKNGKATIRLKAFGSTGRKKVTVTYNGSAALDRAKERITVRVRR